MNIKMLNEPIELEYRGQKFKFFKLPLAGVYKVINLVQYMLSKTGINIVDAVSEKNVNANTVPMDELFSEEIVDKTYEIVCFGTRMPRDIVENLPADVTLFCFNSILQHCIDKDFFYQKILEMGEAFRSLISEAMNQTENQTQN